MSHLTEEELIDVLMGEPHQATLDQHLAGCDTCTNELDLLRDGLTMARRGEPRIPLMVQPIISHTSMDKRIKTSRHIWMAAAAMFFLAIIGLRVEVSDGVLSMEFALIGRSNGVPAQKVQELEQELAQAVAAIEVQADMTQNQLDARMNAFYMERDRDMENFTSMLRTSMRERDMYNAKYLSDVDVRMERRLQEHGIKGKMQ